MPITVIRGYDGLVSEGATPTALLAIEDWSADISVQVNVQGPFLGDAGKLYKVRGGQEIKGQFKGVIPAGLDVPTTAIITALTAGTDINLVLRQGVVGAGTTGQVVTIPTAIISKVKLGQTTKGGATFEADFESSGTFTVT